MRIFSGVVAVALMVAALEPSSAKAPDYDFGPVPVWTDFQAQGEDAVRNRLRDPDSAKFRWPWGLTTIYRKGLLSTLAGYMSCGYVNARNAFGGYTGETAFSVLIDHGRLVDVVIDNRPGGYIEQQCLTSAGRPNGLPPRAPDTSDRDSAPRNTDAGSYIQSLGLQFTQVPDGAYISNVAADGAAAKAGIKPGMVVERVNGLAVRGIALSQIEQMLVSASSQVTLGMVGGQSFTLGGATK